MTDQAMRDIPSGRIVEISIREREDPEFSRTEWGYFTPEIDWIGKREFWELDAPPRNADGDIVPIYLFPDEILSCEEVYA